MAICFAAGAPWEEIPSMGREREFGRVEIAQLQNAEQDPGVSRAHFCARSYPATDSSAARVCITTIGTNSMTAQARGVRTKMERGTPTFYDRPVQLQLHRRAPFVVRLRVTPVRRSKRKRKRNSAEPPVLAAPPAMRHRM